MRCGVAALQLLAGLALVALPQAPAASAEEPLPSREVSLAAWGLGASDEIGWARLGVVAASPPSLVVYHLGRRAPPAPARGVLHSVAPPMSGGRFVVASLRGGNENQLGGFFNAFARAPSEARVAIDDAGPDRQGRALDFVYDRRAGTFAGFWIHLFDSRLPMAERVYLDARDVAWLSFDVRGADGGEPIRVQLADAEWERREDSVPIADVAALVPAGKITTDWQRACLALAPPAPATVGGSTAGPADEAGPNAGATLAERLDRKNLASVVFVVDPEGRSNRTGRIQVRDLSLTSAGAGSSCPDGVASAPLPVGETVVAAVQSGREKKAMWLWETGRILASEAEVDGLVATCRTWGFTDLFVQIPYLEPKVDGHWSERWDEAGMAALVTRLRAVGVAVHALDGAPWYARPAWHERVLMTVAQVAAYNRRVAPAARMVGVRFDIEPYLLPEWQVLSRAAVLADYLALLERAVAEAHAGALVLGVDIPFWFDARDETTGELAAPVVGGATPQPALEAIVDLVDNVGIMDYRTVAYGADGVIAHAAGELAYASKKGKQVFIGLESVPLPDERIITCQAGRLGARHGALVVEPTGPGRARLTFVPASRRAPDGALPPGFAADARVLPLRDELLVPASKITFADKGRAALEDTMRLAVRELRLEPSFVGFVLHSYESLRAWFPTSETRP